MMNCTSASYALLKTSGNDPRISQKMLYAMQVRTLGYVPARPIPIPLSSTSSISSTTNLVAQLPLPS